MSRVRDGVGSGMVHCGAVSTGSPATTESLMRAIKPPRRLAKQLLSGVTLWPLLYFFYLVLSSFTFVICKLKLFYTMNLFRGGH